MTKEIRTIQFKGVDPFNRPVFKVLEKSYYIGSINTLFSHNTGEQEIVDYFKEHKEELIFFGHSFGCEPEGGLLKSNIELIFKETA